MEEKQIPMIDPNLLKPHPRNPRIHTDEQIEAIRTSIREVGFIKPVVIDESNVILCGHGAVQAAKLEEIPLIPFNRVIGLTELQKIAYIIADNKTTDLSWFDMPEVTVLIKEIKDAGFDVSVTGFDFDSLVADDLTDIENFFAPQEETEKKAKTATCPDCGKTFEL